MCGRFTNEMIGAKLHAPYSIHDAPGPNTSPFETLILDVLGLYGRNVAKKHTRPDRSAARLQRLAQWWGNPQQAMKTLSDLGVTSVDMTGHVSDVEAATCEAYVKFVGVTSLANTDLVLLRAAIYYAAAEHLLDRAVSVTITQIASPGARWLTRSEVAKLIWNAWRRKRLSSVRPGEHDDMETRKHLARWMIIALYTGAPKTTILNAAFRQKSGAGLMDLQTGLWHRSPTSARGKTAEQALALPRPLLSHLRRWFRNGQTYPVEFKGRQIATFDKAFRKLALDCQLEDDVVPLSFRHTAIAWRMQRGDDTWNVARYFGLPLRTLLEAYGHHHPHLKPNSLGYDHDQEPFSNDD